MTEGTNPGLPASGSPETQGNLWHEFEPIDKLEDGSLSPEIEKYIEMAAARQGKNEERMIHRLAKRILTSFPETETESAISALEDALSTCQVKIESLKTDSTLSEHERDLALGTLKPRLRVLELTYSYFEEHKLVNHSPRNGENGSAETEDENVEIVVEKVSQNQFLTSETEDFFKALGDDEKYLQSFDERKQDLSEDFEVSLSPSEIAIYQEHLRQEVKSLLAEKRAKEKQVGTLEIEIDKAEDRIAQLREFIKSRDYTKEQKTRFSLTIEKGGTNEKGLPQIRALKREVRVFKEEIAIKERQALNFTHLSDLLQEITARPIEVDEKKRFEVDKRKQLFRAASEKVQFHTGLDAKSAIRIPFIVTALEWAQQSRNEGMIALRRGQLTEALDTLFPTDSKERETYLAAILEVIDDTETRLRVAAPGTLLYKKLERERSGSNIILKFLEGTDESFEEKTTDEPATEEPKIAAAIQEEAPPEDSIEPAPEGQEKAEEETAMEREKRIAASLRKLSSIMIRGEETGKLIDALRYAERLARLELSEEKHRSLNDAQLDAWEKGYRQLEATIKANFEAEDYTALLRAIQDRMTYHYERMKKHRQDAEEMPEPTNEEIAIFQSKFNRAEKEYNENRALFGLLSRIAENLGFPVPDFEF